MRTAPVQLMESRSSIPISIVRRSMFIEFRKWAARPSIQMLSLSTGSLFRIRIGSARRARAFHIFCTASIPSASWLYDHDKPCGAEANSAKFLGARAGHAAAWQAIMTHGGFGYAKEYHVERLFREVSITRLAPITEQLILSFIAEKVLELPKSY